MLNIHKRFFTTSLAIIDQGLHHSKGNSDRLEEKSGQSDILDMRRDRLILPDELLNDIIGCLIRFPANRLEVIQDYSVGGFL